MDAKFVAYFKAIVYSLWLKNLISRLGVTDYTARTFRIYCNNSTTTFFSKNDKYFNGAKHIKVKYLSVNKEVQKQTVSVKHISTIFIIINH